MHSRSHREGGGLKTDKRATFLAYSWCQKPTHEFSGMLLLHSSVRAHQPLSVPQHCMAGLRRVTRRSHEATTCSYTHYSR